MIIMLDLLKRLVELKGSDLHLIAGLQPAIRIHGELKALDDYPRLLPKTAKPYIYDKAMHEALKAFQNPAARPPQTFGPQTFQYRATYNPPPWEKK